MQELFMDRALELAKKSLGRTSPNPLVGAVVVKNNQIVGQGYHQGVGTAHGERVALRKQEIWLKVQIYMLP